VLILLAGILAGAAPLLALTDPSPDELAENRQRLEKWRANPKQYARLLQTYRDFLASPANTRQRLRQLDYALHQEKPSTQARLFDVMERYQTWLERLTPDQRQQLQNARDRKARLEIVRRIREDQWLSRQPLAVRQRIGQSEMAQAALGPSAAALFKPREALLAELRERESQRRQEWQAAFKNWEELTRRRPPLTLALLKQQNPDVHTFVQEYLRPRLSTEEQQRLNTIADKPFQFPRALVELADKYPSALPGPRGPTHFSELPEAVQTLLKPVMDRLDKVPAKGANKLRELKAFLKSAEGKWPRFGTAIAMAAKLRKGNPIRLPFELWPSQRSDLSLDMQKFLEQQLSPELTAEEKKALDDKKTWPAFPLKIEELARQHRLHPPWLTLPGSRERWDLYRAGKLPAARQLPAVPRSLLRQFAARELTDQDRARLGLNEGSSLRWERLKAEYFRRNPQVLKKLKQAEMNKKPVKKRKSK
jgi:hypothetical protein